MPSPNDAALVHARDLLSKVLLFDGHNDLPFVIRRASGGDVAKHRLDLTHPETDTDIPRLIEGQVGAQVFAAFVPTSVPDPAAFTLEQIAIVRDIERLHGDVFAPARSPDDVVAARSAGKIASIVSVESGVGLSNSLAPLRIWHAAGVRILTLCHNETLGWIDSATDQPRHGGLTDFGRRVIGECQRLGVLVDLAHASDKAQHDAIDCARAPMLWSHMNAFALCDHPRNVADDILARVAGNGGIVMATFVPEFISQASYDFVRPFKRWGKTAPGIDPDQAIRKRAAEAGPWPKGSIPELCDHIAYIAGKIGLGHIGVGSDFYGGPNPDDLNDVSRFPHLFAELVRRGWSDEALAGLAGGNMMRVWRDCEAVAAQLAAEPPAVGRLTPDPLRPARRKA